MRILFFLLLWSSAGLAMPTVDEFYDAYKSEDVKVIKSVLVELENAKLSSDMWVARRAALQMKHASKLKVPKEKLDRFKEGKVVLDAKIKADPKNAELRFLRLAIQEHCPKILKYGGNIQEDVQVIIAGYKKQPDKIRYYILFT